MTDPTKRKLTYEQYEKRAMRAWRYICCFVSGLLLHATLSAPPSHTAISWMILGIGLTFMPAAWVFGELFYDTVFDGEKVPEKEPNDDDS